MSKYEEYFYSLRPRCDSLTAAVQNPYPADEMLANLKEAKAELDIAFNKIVEELEQEVKNA